MTEKEVSKGINKAEGRLSLIPDGVEFMKNKPNICGYASIGKVINNDFVDCLYLNFKYTASGDILPCFVCYSEFKQTSSAKYVRINYEQGMKILKSSKDCDVAMKAFIKLANMMLESGQVN